MNLIVGDLCMGKIIELSHTADGSVCFPDDKHSGALYEVTGYAHNGTHLESVIGLIPYYLNHQTLKLIQLDQLMKAISLQDLVEYKSGVAVACVEGLLTKLYDPKTIDTRKGPWTTQDGILTDDAQNTFAIKFGDESVCQPKEMYNKRIHIECKAGQKGSTGLSIKEDQWKDKTTGEPRSKTYIYVTATAQITYPNGAPSARPRQPIPNQTTQSKPNTPNSNTKPMSQAQPQDDEPIGENECFEDRASDWKRGFSHVCQMFGHDPEVVAKGFSSSDIKEITTGLAASFKAKFGMHQRMHFQGEGRASAPSTEPPKDDLKISNWKEVMHCHPKVQKKLADIAPAKQWEYWQWATVFQPGENTNLETKRLQAALLIMGEELKFTHPKYVTQRLKAEKLENDEALDAFANQEYGVDARDMSRENWSDLSKPDRLQALMEFIKGYKSPASGDDDDLPA